MKKILALSDPHIDKETWPVISKVFDFTIEKAIEIKPDFITISGDIFNQAIQNSKRYHIKSIIDKFDELSEIAPIVMIYGTKNHDYSESLEFLRSFKIHIAEPEKPLIIDNTIFYCIPDSRPWEVIDEKNPNKAGQDINEYLRTLCLTYGAHRKNNPTMNAVVLGHGIVRNAKNKNNIVIEKATVYLDESDIAQIGTDVVLYGHIHSGYEFETIPGRALTACQAHTWKDLNYYPAIHEYELEQTANGKGGIRFYNEHRIPFIPRRQKISNYLKNPMPMNEFDGDMIHVEKDKNNPVTKEDLIAAGAHPDSKVTIKPEITHVVRNADIVNMTTRRQEYEAYKKQHGQTGTEEELLTCDKIQEMEIKAGAISGKRIIRLLSTHVRGYMPIWNGMQKEEIEIDWTNFDYGLLGFLGKGGIGKTNFLGLILSHTENITNESKTASLFYLPDSFIVNKWGVNEDIHLRKGLKENKTEYQVFVNDELQVQHSGSLSKYASFVDGVLGTPRMCALSIFATQFSLDKVYAGQKINPDIKRANNSDFKSLFSELLDLENKFAYDYSKKNLDAFAIKAQSKSNEIEGFEKAIDDPVLLDVKKGEIQQAVGIIDNGVFMLNETITGLEDAKKALNDKFAVSQAAEGIVKLHNDRIKVCQSEIETQNSYKHYAGESIEDIKQQIEKLEIKKEAESIKVYDNAEKKNQYARDLLLYSDDMKWYNAKLSEHNQKKQNIINAINKRNEDKRKEHNNKLRSHSLDLTVYNEKKSLYDRTQSSIAMQAFSLKSQIAEGESKFADKANQIKLLCTPCSNCGTINFKKEIQEIEKEIDPYLPRIEELKTKLTELEKIIDSNSFIEIAPTVPADPSYEKIEDSKELQELVFIDPEPTKPKEPTPERIDETIQSKIDELVNKKENVITMNQKSAAAEQVIEKLNKEIKALNLLIESESKKIITDIKQKIIDNENEINSHTKILKEKKEQLNKYNSDIQSLNDRIADIAKKQLQLECYEVELESINHQVELWKGMVDAWGNDGIKNALKLECLAPEVDTEVNNLLLKYYPKLIIQTTTLRKDSTGKRMLEDFNINIINTQTGKTYPFSGLSGEEGNFVMTAFREACKKIAERNANRTFKFAVMDEPDSFVSESLLADYWNMVKEIDEGKEILRICTSHSPAAKELFNQSINVEDL